MKAKDKQALIEDCEAAIERIEKSLPHWQNGTYTRPYLESELARQKIALAALTAQPDELQRRAVAAEERAKNLNDGWLNAIAERDEARAKLADLEKQEPIGMVLGKLGAGLRVSCYFMPDSVSLGDEVFTRPAPAINLAELVPPIKDDSVPGKNDSYIDMCDGWNSCRAAILRNIEQAK